MKNKPYALPLFFFISALCLNAGNFLNSDEGTILNGAWKMYNGQALYADFFSFIPPGSYLFAKWSFDIFGPSYWSVKLFSVLFLLASAYALYGIALLAFADRRTAVLGAWAWVFLSFFPIPLLINYNTYSAYAALIAVFFLARAVTLHKAGDYFLAGIFTGGVGVFLQSKALLLAVGMAAFLAWLVFKKRERILSLAAFAAGTSVLPSMTVAAFGWRTLYEHLVVWPRENYGAVNEVSWLPFLCAAALFVFLARRAFAGGRHGDTTVLALICAAQGALLISVLHRPDPSHLAWNSFAILLLGAHAIADIHDRSQSVFGRIVRKIAHDKPFLVGFAFFFLAVPLAFNLVSISSDISFHKKVRDAGITRFYAHPFLPGMYFEFGIPDPYPYDVLITGIHPEEAFRSNLERLKADDPPFIFADYNMVAKFNYTADNPLDRYILSRYVPFDQWGTLTVLKRANP